jgi:hypothetical protein
VAPPVVALLLAVVALLLRPLALCAIIERARTLRNY